MKRRWLVWLVGASLGLMTGPVAAGEAPAPGPVPARSLWTVPGAAPASMPFGGMRGLGDRLPAGSPSQASDMSGAGSAVDAFPTSADGSEDIAFLEPNSWAPDTLAVRDGEDGTLMWSVALDGLVSATRAQLDETVAPEIVTMEVIPRRELARPTESTLRILVRRGDSGEEVWRYEVTSTGLELPIGKHGEHVPVHLDLAGDADGDGFTDVVVETASSSEAWTPAGRLVLEEPTTTATVLSGPSGSVVGQIRTEGMGSATWGDSRVVPAGDLSGDGRADLLTLDVADGDYSLSAWNVGTGEPIWSVPSPMPWFVQIGQVDGSGPADVLLYWPPYPMQGRYMPSGIGSFDGATGAVIWQTTPAPWWPPLLADVTGDGTSELLCPDCFGGWPAVYSGVTGEYIWIGSSPRPGWRLGFAERPVEDLTGDGAPDPVFGSWPFCPREDGPPERRAAFDGMSGGLLWTDEFSSGRTPASGFGGDVDGDDRADLISYAAEGGLATISVWRGATRKLVWTHQVPTKAGDDDCGVYVAPLAVDVDGDGVDEVLVTIFDGGTSEPMDTVVLQEAGIRWSR